MGGRERDLDFFLPPERFFDTERDADFRPFFFGGGDRDSEPLLDLAFLLSFAAFFLPRDAERELFLRSFDLDFDRPFFLSSRLGADADLDGFRRSLDLARLPRDSERFLVLRSAGERERFFLARPPDRERERFLGAGDEGRRFRMPDLLLEKISTFTQLFAP